MVTREDIESFLDRLTSKGGGATYTEIEPGLWVVKPPGSLDLDIIVHYSPPVVLLRMKVMNVPTNDGKAASLNRTAAAAQCNRPGAWLVWYRAGFGRPDAGARARDLDFDEFLASYEGMTLALTAHLRELSTYREAR